VIGSALIETRFYNLCLIFPQGCKLLAYSLQLLPSRDSQIAATDNKGYKATNGCISTASTISPQPTSVRLAINALSS